MKTSLVTGGAGFIGSHVAENLLRIGHRVVVMDDLSGGFEENIPAGAEFIRGSIVDHELVDHAFRQFKPNFVFHLAAYAAEGLSHFIKRFNYTNNLIGSVNLINASVNNGVERFIFTSSIAVYGSIQSPMTEDCIPIPEDPYGIAKLAVEHELRVSKEMFGLNYVIFRPHNVFGPKQNIGDPYRNVVGIFMKQILLHQPMTIFGDGEQKRAFSFISDVAPIIAEAAEHPDASGRTFNIGADEPNRVNYLAESVAAAMGVPVRKKHLPPRQEVKVAFAGHTRLKSVFGNRATVGLTEGLKATAAWVQKHGFKQGTSFNCIEIKKNLPEAWLVETAVKP